MKKACSAEFAAATGAELDRLLGADLSQGVDFEAVGQAARRFALEFMGRLIAQRLNASEREREGTVRCGGCG